MGKKKLRREIARLRDTISHMEWEIKELIDNPDTLGSEIIKSNYRHKNELENMMWKGDCSTHGNGLYGGGIKSITIIHPNDMKLCNPLECDGTCSKCNDCESDNNNV